MITSRKSVVETTLVVLSLLVVLGAALLVGQGGITGSYIYGPSSNCNPPAIGNWTITSGTVVCAGENLLLNGSIIVNGSATLILEETNFSINTTVAPRYELFLYDNANLTVLNTNFEAEDEFWRIWAYDDSTTNIQNTTFDSDSGFVFSDFSTNYLKNVNMSHNSVTEGNATSTFVDLTFNLIPSQSLTLDEDSNNTFINSTINSQIQLRNNQNTFYNTNLLNETRLQQSSKNYFYNGSINYISWWTNDAQIYGNVTMPSTQVTNFFASPGNRTYPIYVVYANTSIPYPNKQVNITNSTGHLIWNGTTDSTGFVEATISYYRTTGNLYNDNYNISTNETQDFGLLKNTPITLEASDKTSPIIHNVTYTPSNPSSSDDITIYVNVSDTPSGLTLNCSLSGDITGYNTSTSTGTYQIIPIDIGTLSEGIHFYNVSCTDNTNTNISYNHNITVNDPEIDLTLINPTTPTTFIQNTLNNFTVEACCYDNDCGTFNVTGYYSDYPYIPGGYTTISTCEELQNINNNLAGDYILVNDIDCSNTTTWNSGQGFVPIGALTFTGTLDGQGYTINNLFINRSGTSNQGLFNKAADFSIRNVGLVDANIVAGSFTGGFVGSVDAPPDNSSLTNCFILDSNISCSGTMCGGLIGNAANNFINNCYVENLNIYSTSYKVGGLIGSLDPNNLISVINNSYAKDVNVQGLYSVGGLIGFAIDGASTYIINSYVIGNITSTSTNANMRGTGGLIGRVYNSAIDVKNSYAVARISGPGPSGGLFGNLATSITSSNLWWYNVSGDATNSCVGSGTVTCNLENDYTNFYDKTHSVYTGTPEWDFEDIWQEETNDYPSLSTFDNVVSFYEYNNISTSSTTPFWTTINNPYEVTLNKDQCTNITWLVNATGTPGSQYVLFGKTNPESEKVIISITGSNTLAIWDETDTITKQPNDNITFYANYTDIVSGDAINTTDAYCLIDFNLTGNYQDQASMTFNDTSRLYEYNRSFVTGGDYTFRVQCNSSAYGYNTAVADLNITSDTTPPYYWNITTSDNVYAPNKDYYFNISWNDTDSELDEVWINFSNTIYTSEITNISEIFMFNRTNLAVGSYSYEWFANDTYGYQNQTGVLTYNIIKANSTCSLVFDKVSPQDYGTTVTATCSCTNPEQGALLYRNGINVNATENGNPILLNAQTHNYVCNVSETTSYNSASNSSSFTIDKDIPSFTSSVTSPIIYGTASDYTASEANTGDDGCLYSLYRNGVVIDTGSIVNDPDVLAQGTYTYVYNTTGCANYTNASDTKTLVVNRNSTVLTLTSNPNWNYGYGNQTNISCTASNSEVSPQLFRNNTPVSNPYLAYLSAGSYNFTCNVSQTQNYTSNTTSNILTITNKQPSCSLSFDKSSPIAYGNALTATCTCTNPETTATLYRNGVNVSTENNVATILNAQTHNYVCNSSATQNYSSASNSSSFIVVPNAPSLSMSLTGNPIDYGTSEGVLAEETNNGDSDCTYNLYRNGTLINTGSSISNNSILSAGSYLYVYNTSGCANYSSNSISTTLTINKITPTLSLTINPSTNEDYGTQTNITVSCPSQLICNAYRDNAPVVAPDTQTLTVGTYVYIYNTTGNVNYTNASITGTLTINKLTQNAVISILPNNVVEEGTSITVNCNGNLTRNGVHVESQIGVPVALTQGSYDYSCYLPGNATHEYDDDNLTLTVTAPSGGTSGGGSTGGSLCTTNWVCTNWTCNPDNTETRSCTDLNGCNRDIPEILRSCTYECVSDYVCEPWTECINAEQTRVCRDMNSCYPGNTTFTETQSCIHTEIACSPNIICEYSECIDGYQNEYCYDTNNCIEPTNNTIACQQNIIGRAYDYIFVQRIHECKELLYELIFLIAFFLLYNAVFFDIDAKINAPRYKIVRLINTLCIILMLLLSLFIILFACYYLSKVIALFIFIFLLSRSVMLYYMKYFDEKEYWKNINEAAKYIDVWKVAYVGIKKKKGYFYFVDKDGDISCEKISNMHKLRIKQMKKEKELEDMQKQKQKKYYKKQKQEKQHEKIKRQKQNKHYQYKQKYYEKRSKENLQEFKEISYMIKEYRKNKSLWLRLKIKYKYGRASEVNKARIKHIFNKI